VRVRKECAERRSVAVDGCEFVARFLQHVLPPGFKRIRHYGLLAPAAKQQRLASARTLLCMPQPNVPAVEDAIAFMRRIAALEIARCSRRGTLAGNLRAKSRSHSAGSGAAAGVPRPTMTGATDSSATHRELCPRTAGAWACLAWGGRIPSCFMPCPTRRREGTAVVLPTHQCGRRNIAATPALLHCTGQPYTSQ
jgi:hypothetical protein